MVGVMTAVLLSLTVVTLRFEGRIWWCLCRQKWLWTPSAWSEHTSQHLLDPYTFTHVLHGFLFWWILARWSNSRRDPWLFLAAVAAESAWEILENSQFIIDRYRAATAAIGYSGDSIVNSLADVASCAMGFLVARWLGWRWAIVMFIATETALALWIRDSLLLNIMMLIWPTVTWPMPFIRQWQIGG